MNLTYLEDYMAKEVTAEKLAAQVFILLAMIGMIAGLVYLWWWYAYPHP